MKAKHFKEKAERLFEQGDKEAKQWAEDTVRPIQGMDGFPVDAIKTVSTAGYATGYQKGVLAALNLFKDILDVEVKERAETAKGSKGAN